jgi:hypothetical protein
MHLATLNLGTLQKAFQSQIKVGGEIVKLFFQKLCRRTLDGRVTG